MKNELIPFPPASLLDHSGSTKIKFLENTDIAEDVKKTIGFLKKREDWCIDEGVYMVVAYEKTMDTDYGAAIRFTWSEKYKDVSLEMIPRRNQTAEFARANGERVIGQWETIRLHRCEFDIFRETLHFSEFKKTPNLRVIRNCTLDLTNGLVTENRAILPLHS